MTILVTGGAGFIGSHVVDRLYARGYEPRIFDRVRSPYVDGDVESIIGDVLDREALDRAARGCEAIVHLAAVADVNDVAADPARADHVNVRGTQHALDASRSNDVPRFVYASTVWVYGGAEENGHFLDEDTPLVIPSHFYTATKLAGEMYCRAYAESYELGQMTLRFGIPYGPRSRAAGVVAAFVSRALASEPILIAGDGLQTRQFVYVEDLAEGVVAALADDAPPGVYNLVREETLTILQIAEQVRELVAGVPIVHVESRRLDVQSRPVSAERAALKLGWRANTRIEEGIRSYVDWVTATDRSPSPSADPIAGNSEATSLHEEPAAL